MQLGTTHINGISALAPMAGVADRAMRELCVGFGAAWCVSEMVSAKGLVLGDRESARLLEVSGAERPMAVQLFGSEPEIMHRAVKMAAEHSPEAIDINMGCPAPKITSGGAGSAMMKTPALCGEVTAAAVEAAGGIPVTVKMRTGWDEENKNFLEVAHLCEKAGCAAITLHARTRQRMYAPPAEWERIAELKREVSVPVIGNGDVASGDDAVRMLRQTGCDMVMVGRAALGDPWIFERISAAVEGRPEPPLPPIAERMQTMRRHIGMLCEYKGEYVGMREARRHCAWYMRSMRGAAKLRTMCVKLEKPSDLDELIAVVLSEDRDLGTNMRPVTDF